MIRIDGDVTRPVHVGVVIGVVAVQGCLHVVLKWVVIPTHFMEV